MRQRTESPTTGATPDTTKRHAGCSTERHTVKKSFQIRTANQIHFLLTELFHIFLSYHFDSY
ncbi:hypothetical protein C4K16_4101 [Pseudomonas chlororaphis subsp. aurantiaca]|nr:hypothetical protein C4K16_4101 [Pseudomonas chlororaphis subsp. aurantiaca]